MKYGIFSLLLFTLLLGACRDDDDAGGGNIVIFNNPETVINYDDANFSAPQLPQGDYEMAALYPASTMQAQIGKKLKQVAVYLTNSPPAVGLNVYGPGANGAAGELLYTADLKPGSTIDSWNVHTLSPALELDGEDLWVSIFVSHPELMGSVGCDEGPAVNNGDKLYEYGVNDWSDLRIFTNNASNINWNIRANIGD